MKIRLDCRFVLKTVVKLLSAVVYATSLTAFAITPLFDFESAEQVNSLPYRTRGASALDIVQKFATSGTNSLRFTSTRWEKGMPEWPQFELTPQLRDWSGYDRLVVDIVNPAEERFVFGLYVSDTRVPFREGLSHSFSLASRGVARCVIPLNKFPSQVNRADINILHFFTLRGLPANETNMV